MAMIVCEQMFLILQLLLSQNCNRGQTSLFLGGVNLNIGALHATAVNLLQHFVFFVLSVYFCIYRIHA